MSYTTNIQYKNTDLCMDMNCPECGRRSHVDSYFVFRIQCPYCDAVFQMPTEVPLKKLDPPDVPDWGVVRGEKADGD